MQKDSETPSLKSKKSRNLRDPKVFLSSVGLGLLALFIYFFIFFQLPSPYSLKNYKAIPLSTHILDRKGRLLYEIFKEENRSPVKFSELPDHVSRATIAIEDKDFYKHKGVSFVGGILRAARETVFKKNLQGGSTITQQLIKSALLSPERTIRRKIREIILALWTERIFSKQEILEFYLNQVPYGGSSYGIEVAARNFFGKSAKKLSLAEAAFLAGLPQAPSLYSPYSNPDLAIRRRNDVLTAMKELKYISQEEYDKAVASKLNVKPPQTNIKAPHFVFYVKNELEKEFGAEAIEEGGLRVTTTLDLDIQQYAEEVLKEELEQVKNLQVSNGAVLVTRPPTGEILAMVGSQDYFATPSGSFNVTTALRQPGSSIKPINYAIGIDRKLVTAASVFLDARTCFPDPGRKPYCPVNYDGSFHGPVQLRYALANSYNIPAVKMLALNTVEDFVASSSAFGITSFKDPSNYGLSLTLGGGEVRMTEMATAFSSFANQGSIRKVHGILKVEDKDKKVITEFKDRNFIQNVRNGLSYPSFLSIGGDRAISKETAFIISHILSDNGARSSAFGSVSQLVIPRHTVSVKTGTTDDKRDNWTIGYTPNFLTTVWVGNNDNTPMNPFLTSGVTGAAPIWNKIMTYVLSTQPDIKPPKPVTVVGRSVCSDGGGTTQKEGEARPSCPTRFEYFVRGTSPKGLSVSKEQVWVTKDSDKLAKEGDPNTELKEKTIIKDSFSTYCLDCAGDRGPTPTPTP